MVVSNQHRVSLRWQFINASSQRYSHHSDNTIELICDRNGLTSSAALKMTTAAAGARTRTTLSFAAAAG
jgi:hypothetical protein